MTAPELEVPRTRRPGFAGDLADYGDRLAVVAAGGDLSYADLAARVDDLVHALGPVRRLVLVAGANQLDPLVGYLAGLAGDHVVLLTSADQPQHLASLVRRYDPDVVLATVGGEWVVDERRYGTAHELHPDLALLLSTSGSTGSPKLVRLSHANLQANAESIASFLDIADHDRAVTSLPLHYSYGLAVVNSHLLRGAGLVLTDLSVVDPCFWELVRDHRVTSLAGVPYTFDLLDRIGFADLELPHLRSVTQAGGRLAPDRVAAYAELGLRRGWDFYVMYGQTEATARIAYLPPHLATAHPSAIGVPVPGGSIRLDPVGDPGDQIGELVYSGPNVMLGYAECPADLALGRMVDELRTGDLARRLPGDLFEIVGRQSRVAKVFGLRIDLAQVESVLDEHGVTACALADGDRLAVVVEGDTGVLSVETIAKREFGLPHLAVHVVTVDVIPRSASGKANHVALRALVDADSASAADDVEPPPVVDVTGLRDAFASVLRRPDATADDTFVSLGGDSLSYVEMSIVIEQALGHLPLDWHVTPIRDLAPTRRLARPGWRSMETSVVLRAAAILMIVATHADLARLQGGAHVLLAIAGFNVARFQLTAASRATRLRNLAGGITRIAVPSVVWIACMFVLSDGYRWQNLLLLNGVFGPRSPDWGSVWHYWFVEVLVYYLLALMVLVAIPLLDRTERRFPFAVPVALVLLGLITRFDVLGFAAGPPVLAAHVVFWVFAIGWAVARANSVAKRVVMSVVVVATIPGFFDRPVREATVIAGILLLIWIRSVRLPRLVGRGAAVLASASLYIYLTHWQVYPLVTEISTWLAVLVSLAVGIAYWLAFTRVAALVTPWPRTALRQLVQHEREHGGGPGAEQQVGSDGQGPRRSSSVVNQ